MGYDLYNEKMGCKPCDKGYYSPGGGLAIDGLLMEF